MDQEVMQEEAVTRASQAASLMRKVLESGNMRDGIRYASQMLEEFQNPLLSPKSYYALCK